MSKSARFYNVEFLCCLWIILHASSDLSLSRGRLEAEVIAIAIVIGVIGQQPLELKASVVAYINPSAAAVVTAVCLLGCGLASWQLTSQ